MGIRQVPHSLVSARARICLITADPPASKPNVYKDLVQSDNFPVELKQKISKVIACTKLRGKYKSFESRRQLAASFDVFLADERIANVLPAALGSTFYKSTTKRPIPVCLTGKSNWGKKPKPDPLSRLAPKRKVDDRGGPDQIGEPHDVATDIKKVLGCTFVSLSPSATTSIKAGYVGWPEEWISENIGAITDRLVTKHIPGGWTGVKGIYIKSPDSAALPIWVSENVWKDEDDVLDVGETAKGINMEKKARKRKNDLEISRIPGGANTKKQKPGDPAESKDSESKTSQSNQRKDKLKQLKDAAVAGFESDSSLVVAS